MEKTAVHKVILSIIFGCIALSAAFGENVTKKPFDASFTESHTGAVFPAVTGVFNKVQVRVNQDERIGTTISYENENGAFADVYIYTLPEKVTLQDHVEKLVRALETLPEHSHIVLGVNTLSKDPVPWKKLPYKYSLNIRLHEEQLYSVMWIFQHKDNVIRIRVTVPKDLEDAENAASTFCKSIYELTTKQAK